MRFLAKCRTVRTLCGFCQLSQRVANNITNFPHSCSCLSLTLSLLSLFLALTSISPCESGGKEKEKKKKKKGGESGWGGRGWGNIYLREPGSSQQKKQELKGRNIILQSLLLRIPIHISEKKEKFLMVRTRRTIITFQMINMDLDFGNIKAPSRVMSHS